MIANGMNDFQFYDNSILPGTKISEAWTIPVKPFYDNSILSGTKIALWMMMFLQAFYDNSILSGTKIICLLVINNL